MAGDTTFNGFPAEGIQFLRDLGENNHKEWFEAHKKTYIDNVQTPALVDAVMTHFVNMSPIQQWLMRALNGGT